MKCPRCWTQKAYLRHDHGWKTALLSWLLFRAMKCHHCYHRFYTHWVLTLGKRVEPPVLRVSGGQAHTEVRRRRGASANNIDDPQRRSEAA